jgi:hypothetical protein
MSKEKDERLVQVSSWSKRQVSTYLILPILCPILIVVSAFVILPSHWFTVRSDIPYLVNMGYADSLHHHECQVLLYGDSSAMTDLSPKLITEQTGLSACNIAEYQGLAHVTKTLMVDEYLANNPRPRYIVFMYTPDDLMAPTWKFSSYESTTYLVQRRRSLATAWQLAIHPKSTLDWATHGMRMVLLRVRAAPFPPSVYRLRADQEGLLPNPRPTIHTCGSPNANIAPDRAWIKELRSRYETSDTTVLVDATPTSACDVSLPFYQVHLDGLVDNSPYQAVPDGSFTDGGRLHANALGITRISSLVASQINEKMAKDANSSSTKP